MIPVAALLLAGALFLAGSAFWVKVKRAEETIAEGWARIADVQRHIDEARDVIDGQQARLSRLASDGEWLDAPTLGERVVEPLYDRQLEEMFAAPAADIWEDGDCPKRRGER